ncbi:hypothetical protein MKX03_023635 [Papaver bracteatum]|nr:hypothetical protein MKX03_023635 [Papaver bracteatum]
MSNNSNSASDAFEFEMFEGDPENLKTVVATAPNQITWIDFSALIGLATHHRSTEDYDEHHEVAAKMLHPIKEDHMQAVVDRFQNLIPTYQGIQNICIVMKFYEGSIGDRMARLKGGKLPLPDVLRYEIELAQGTGELPLKGILVLKLKQCNFLLNENDQVFLGDMGIPSLLLCLELPTYVAPEQWEPDVRGLISLRQFMGCGRSMGEIFQSVYIKQEKPHLPIGLPSALENILCGCFEYDFRKHPLMVNLLEAFKRRISQILPNGCLVVKFPDPAKVELVSFRTCAGVVKKYQHLKAFHWEVRPLIFSLGLFTAVRLGVLVGRSKRKTDQTMSVEVGDGKSPDAQTGGNNLFRE